jgi:hypothetical protein
VNDPDAADRTARRGQNERGHRPPGGKPRVSVDSFRRDPMYPQIERAVAAILASSKGVAPVDVIVRLGWLSTANLENWRFGRVPYLERVIRCNLTRLSRFLRILGFHCHDLNLTASQTAYVMGQGTADSAALHQDPRSSARASLRAPFRLARQWSVSSTASEG